METKIIINNNRGEVQAFEGDVQVGQINFNKEEGLLSIEHTEVIEAFAKKGVAGILVQAATDYAVHHELKVKPICSYARKWFKQHRQYKKIVVDLK